VSAAIIDPGSPVRSRRDSAFRAEVLSAWEHRCAFCGFNVQLDNSDIALDAAHIRWCQFGGPDSINNGLACCSIHHQAFDRGAISISGDQRILISSRVYGNGGLDSLFVALSGTPLRKPNRKSAAPKRDFLDWHRTQVFRGQARS
ncbi:MAG: HNH endonuclease, partial [Bryobacteraceae bacterium]